MEIGSVSDCMEVQHVLYHYWSDIQYNEFMAYSWKKVAWNGLSVVMGLVFICILVYAIYTEPQRTLEFESQIAVMPTSTSSLSVTPTDTPTPTPTVIPVSIVIEKLGIDTIVEPVGVTKDGNMDTPVNAKNVGWYQYGTVPGAPGNAVLTGHYDTVTGKPAIFYHLQNLAIGDRVNIRMNDGRILPFMVTGTDVIAYDVFPTGYVFAQKSGINVNLITCGGIWDTKEKIYKDRVVIYTTYDETDA